MFCSLVRTKRYFFDDDDDDDDDDVMIMTSTRDKVLLAFQLSSL